MAFRSSTRPRPNDHGPGCVDCGAPLLNDATLTTFGARRAEDGTVLSGNGSPLVRCWPCRHRHMIHEWAARDSAE